jgi:hypothetical protein
MAVLALRAERRKVSRMDQEMWTKRAGLWDLQELITRRDFVECIDGKLKA